MRPQSPAGRRPPRSDRARGGLVVATLALCGTVVSLQQTLVLPLLPDFPRLLDTSADTASWLVTATLLSGAVATPTLSRLADMYGKKRMMLLALAVTVAGSLLGAFSGTLWLVITARALQGVGMALVPIGIAIMRDELPRDRVPLGVALMSATLAVGAGAGLPLAGLIAEHLDWRAVFWVTAVAATVMLVAVAVVLSESPVRTRGSFDYRGALVLSAALTAMLLSLSKGGQWGWTAPTTLLLAGGGLLLLAAWVPLELRARNPLVDVRVAARPAVLLVNIASVLTGFAMFANMLVTTQLLQLPASTGYGLGLDVLQTGLWMAPSALVFGVVAPLSASLIRRFGPQATLLSGALLMAVSYVARVYLSHDLSQVVAGSMLVAMGTSMTYAAMPTLIMRAVPVTETASANGLNTLLRSIGTSGSSATMAAVTTIGFVRVGAEVFPSFGTLVTLLWIAAGMSLAAAVVVVPMFGLRELADDPLDAADHMHDTVVHGRVVSRAGEPIRNAVVTVLTTTGEQVDWSRVDSAGDFSVAIPGSGRYLVVTSADGWTPASRVDLLTGRAGMAPVVLSERLTLTGVVRDRAVPVAGALVALTRPGGEAPWTTYTARDGHYELPLPANGRYVLSAMAGASTAAQLVSVWGSGRVVDVDLDADAGAASAPDLSADQVNR